MRRLQGNIAAKNRRFSVVPGRISTFSSDEDGATAVEFGLVAIPFAMLIFAIIELALIFFVSASLSNAVSEAGRTIRVGSFQACGGAQEFRELVCQNMKDLMNCENNLRIDVKTGNTFDDITMPDPGMSGLGEDDGSGGTNDTSVNNGEYDSAVAVQPTIVRAVFYYPLVIPGGLTRLESIPGTDRHIISSTTAFMTEPFPSGGSCGVTIE